MKKDIFFNQLKETLELEENTMNEETKILINSFLILSLIAFIDENFNKKLKINDLKSIIDVKSLMNIIGLENFE